MQLNLSQMPIHVGIWHEMEMVHERGYKRTMVGPRMAKNMRQDCADMSYNSCRLAVFLINNEESELEEPWSCLIALGLLLQQKTWEDCNTAAER